MAEYQTEILVLLGMAAFVGFLIWKSKKSKGTGGPGHGGPFKPDRPGKTEEK